MRLLLVSMLLLSACQQAETTRTIDMYNSAGDLTGTAAFFESEAGVRIKIEVEGLSPGLHGIHIHEHPICEGPDFKSAGNHFNPEGKEHGLMHPQGAHIGDLPNVEASGNGLVDVELLVSGATLLKGKKSLLQEGTSLIITEDSDDGVSQPAGNSGARLLCGELKNNENKEKTSPTDPTEGKNKEESDEE